MEELKYYLNIKRQKELTEEETKKIDLILKYLEQKEIFFYMDIDTIYGIFSFLEIPDERRQIIYQNLISPESYKESFPVNRMIKEENEPNYNISK